MFKSVIWDFSSKILNQLISLVVSIVLARILTPADFGIVGIALVFVGFSTLFLDLGFRNSIVYEQDRSPDLYSTVVIVNLLGAIVLSAIILICAPLISRFYNEPAIEKVIRVITILFVLNAATLVPNALNSKELKFRSLALISISSSLISGIVAITLALNGFGLWSILVRAIISGLMVCALNWLICSWKFRFRFRLKTIKKIWPHSSRFFVTTLMEGLLLRLDVLIIGKIFNPATVGYYTRAQSLDNISRELTSGTMYSVLLPYFSSIQTEAPKVLQVYKQCLHMVSFVVLAISGFFFINAREIFIVLFTEKWLPSVEIFQLLTAIGFIYTISVVMNILLSGIGKTKEYLRLETTKKIILLAAYFTSLSGSIFILLSSLLVAYTIGLILNLMCVSKVLDVGVGEQGKIIFRYLSISVVVIWLAVHFQNRYFDGFFTKIVVFGGGYLFAYSLLNYAFRNDAAHLLVSKYGELKVALAARLFDSETKNSN